MKSVKGLRLLACGLVCSCFALVSGAPAHADEKTDNDKVIQFRKGLGNLPDTNPTEAVARYKEFFNANPNLNPNVQLHLYTTVINLMHRGAHDAKGALELADWALTQYPKESGRLQVLAEKARILIAEKKAEEAEQILQDELPFINTVRTTYGSPALYHYAAALEAQEKTSLLIRALQQMMISNPLYLEDPQQINGWMYEKLIEKLLAAKKYDEALRWAKVHYMECRYDEGALTRATRGLVRVWAAQGNAAAVGAFLKAQNDPAQPNPLDIVPPPALLPELLRVVPLDWNNAPGRAKERANLAILNGEVPEAMAEAHARLAANPDVPDNVNEICRLFKAADLNLVRAGAFLEFLKADKAAKVADPVAAYLKKYGIMPRSVLKPGIIKSPPTLKITMPLLFVQFRAGTLTPREAWKQGLMGADDIFRAIQIQGVVDWTDADNIRNEMVGLLVEFETERLRMEAAQSQGRPGFNRL